MKLLLLLVGCVAVLGQATDLNESKKELVPEFRFFGAKSTTTYTDVSLATITVFSSCIRSVVAGISCRGKRKARKLTNSRKSVSDMNEEAIVDDDLSASFHESVSENTEETQLTDTQRTGKFVTVWTTARTTATVTIKTTNSATTISLVFACTNGLNQYPKYSCILG